jgi:hypothetical protein
LATALLLDQVIALVDDGGPPDVDAVGRLEAHVTPQTAERPTNAKFL